VITVKSSKRAGCRPGEEGKGENPAATLNLRRGKGSATKANAGAGTSGVSEAPN